MAKTLSLAFTFLALVSFHTPVLAQYPAESLEQLKKDIRAIMDEEGIPGASIALVTGDEVIWPAGWARPTWPEMWTSAGTACFASAPFPRPSPPWRC